MRLKYSQKNWDLFGKVDPLGAILTVKGKRWGMEEFFRTGEIEIADLINHLASLGIKVNTAKALDFGCGIGRLTQALANRFSETHGVDIAPSMIELANKHNKFKNTCLYHVNAENNLKLFRDKTFDFILSKITLQHIQPAYARNYLREFARVAKPRGIIVFQLASEPIEKTRKNTLRHKIKNLVPALWADAFRTLKFSQKPVTEMYGMPPEKIKRVLENAGARVINIKKDSSAQKWTSYLYTASV